MAGYDPRCPNCFKCMTCKGSGTVETTKSGQRPDKSYAVWKERVTCTTCRGVGGKPGAGQHDHR